MSPYIRRITHLPVINPLLLLACHLLYCHMRATAGPPLSPLCYVAS